MSANHTPGPWSREYISGALRHIERNCDRESFCSDELCDSIEKEEVRYPSYHRGDDVSLITAAPDLLESVKCGRQKLATYLHVFSGDKELSALLVMWDAAIAKAEGKQ